MLLHIPTKKQQQQNQGINCKDENSLRQSTLLPHNFPWFIYTCKAIVRHCRLYQQHVDMLQTL